MNDQAYCSTGNRLAFADSMHCTCWYCDHKVADGQRFCNKACAEAFEDDELAVERRVLAARRDSRPAFL
jgi:hypothetical protein